MARMKCPECGGAGCNCVAEVCKMCEGAGYVYVEPLQVRVAAVQCGGRRFILAVNAVDLVVEKVVEDVGDHSDNHHDWDPMRSRARKLGYDL